MLGEELLSAAVHVGIEIYDPSQHRSRIQNLGSRATKDLLTIPLTVEGDVCLGVFRHEPEAGVYEKSQDEARSGIHPAHDYRYICAVTEGFVFSSNGMNNLRNICQEARLIRANRKG